MQMVSDVVFLWLPSVFLNNAGVFFIGISAFPWILLMQVAPNSLHFSLPKDFIDANGFICFVVGSCFFFLK